MKSGYPAYIWFLFLFNVLLAGIVLAFDLKSHTPISFAPLYSLVILFSWVLPRKLTIGLVVICIGFSIYAIIQNIQKYDELMDVMLGGIVGLASVIVTYFLVLLTQNSMGELKKTNEYLNEEIESRTHELKSRVQELQSHKGLLEESKDLLTTMQVELKKSERKYQLMIEKIQDYAVVLLDTNGNIATWNSGARAIWKSEAREALGQNFFQFLANDMNPDLMSAREVFEKARSEGNASFEGFRKTKSGELIYTVDNISAIEGEGDELVGYTWITHDRTESKRHEDEIIQLNKSLEIKVQKRTKDLESFVYSVSHDLRAPLRAVNGFSEILKQELKSVEGNETIDRYVGFIIDNAKRMNQLIEDLLQFSRMGNKKLVKEEINMSELIDEVHKEILIQFPEYENHKLSIDSELPQVSGDRALLKQVVVNYMSNAYKYSAKKDKPELRINVKSENELYQFCFADNGAGFDEKYGSKLFQVFQRLHDGSEFEGNGIGLAMVKQIIENHGGEVKGEGVLNEGAKFYFSLPIDV